MYAKERNQVILEKNPIDKVVDKLGIKTHKRGDNLIVDECPFCGEKSVMAVSPKYNFFKCYRCGESGSRTRLIMKVKNVTREQAFAIMEGWNND